MKKFTIRERVTIERVIIVEGENMQEVQKNYENGDYDEELESCYFDGQYDDVNYTIEDEDGYLIQNKERGEYTEEVEDSGWDGCCPYCGSCNVDFVDEIDGETKYICRCCNEDFLFDEETGECTDRHRRPIRKEEE